MARRALQASGGPVAKSESWSPGHSGAGIARRQDLWDKTHRRQGLFRCGAPALLRVDSSRLGGMHLSAYSFHSQDLFYQWCTSEQSSSTVGVMKLHILEIKWCLPNGNHYCGHLIIGLAERTCPLILFQRQIGGMHLSAHSVRKPNWRNALVRSFGLKAKLAECTCP